MKRVFVSALLLAFLLSPLSAKADMDPNPKFERAQALALRMLEGTKPYGDFVLLLDVTKEYPFGWVFGYASRKQLLNGDTDGSGSIPGKGPLVVTHNGHVQFMPAGMSTDAAAKAFQANRR
jgi:hypothetical protein